jgi:hypothetical protein
MDIAIMNHRRQQGLGNIIPLLYLGKKVFLRHDASSFPFLSLAGCTIFDTCTLNRSNFTAFKYIDLASAEANKFVIEKMINPSYYAQLWNNLFNRHQS